MYLPQISRKRQTGRFEVVAGTPSTPSDEAGHELIDESIELALSHPLHNCLSFLHCRIFGAFHVFEDAVRDVLELFGIVNAPMETSW